MVNRGEKKRAFVLATLFYLLLPLDSGFYFVDKGGMVLYLHILLAAMLAIMCKAHVSRNSFLILYSLIALVFI